MHVPGTNSKNGWIITLPPVLVGFQSTETFGVHPMGFLVEQLVVVDAECSRLVVVAGHLARIMHDGRRFCTPVE
jgi:hypothetical protein